MPRLLYPAMQGAVRVQADAAGVRGDDRRGDSLSRRAVPTRSCGAYESEWSSPHRAWISSAQRSCATCCSISSGWRSRPSCFASRAATATLLAMPATGTTRWSLCSGYERASCWPASIDSCRTSTGKTTVTSCACFSPAATSEWPERASELVLPFDFPDRELLEESLPDQKLHVPQRGVRRDLIDLAEQNARHLLEELKLASAESDVRAGEPVYELARELSLHKLPRTMVCFDISTTQGTDTVGSCVFFENGRSQARRVPQVQGEDRRRHRRLRVDARSRHALLQSAHRGREAVARSRRHRRWQGAAVGCARCTGIHLDWATAPLISLAKREEEDLHLGPRRAAPAVAPIRCAEAAAADSR